MIPTDLLKSARNRCVIEVFSGVLCCQLYFWIFRWYRGFCHRTESNIFLFPSFDFTFVARSGKVEPVNRLTNTSYFNRPSEVGTHCGNRCVNRTFRWLFFYFVTLLSFNLMLVSFFIWGRGAESYLFPSYVYLIFKWYSYVISGYATLLFFHNK